MPKDIVDNIKATAGWAGATISTTTDTDSAIIVDTQGFDSLAYLVYSGTITDGAYVLKILESDSSTFADSGTEVSAYQVQDSFADTEDNTVQKVGAALTKRYTKLRITSSGTSSGGVFKGAIAILGGALNKPVA